MKKFGIIYGSLTGTTAEVARRIAKVLDVPETDILKVQSISPTKLADYDVIVAGTSTWGSGEIERDWYDFIDGLEGLSLKGKKFAVFGCGDETMANTFCDGVKILYDALLKTGAEPIGEFIAGPYNFNKSEAVKDGLAVGLLLDEVNHPDASDARIVRWCDDIKAFSDK